MDAFPYIITSRFFQKRTLHPGTVYRLPSQTQIWSLPVTISHLPIEKKTTIKDWRVYLEFLLQLGLKLFHP